MTTVAIPTLTTERLVLRAPTMADFPAVAACRALDRTAFVGGPQASAAAFTGFRALFGHWALRGLGRWLVADRRTVAALGVVGPFHPVDWPGPEIAWTVFEQAEGGGVAWEAAMAARDWAYRFCGWTNAISMIDPANARSLALARRLGARPDGTHRHPDYGLMHVWRQHGPEAQA